LAVENLNHDLFSVPKSISLASHSCLSNIELTELLVFVAAVKAFISPRLTCFMMWLCRFNEAAGSCTIEKHTISATLAREECFTL
jgi:hypothetical protein